MCRYYKQQYDYCCLAEETVTKIDHVVNNTIIILLLSTTHITPVFMIDSFNYWWYPQVFSICITS